MIYMKDVVIKAEDIYFSYDDEKSHSLNGLSLEIERGRKVAVMGANGSGKSTFFLTCNGIHQPSRGTLYLDGKPIAYNRKGLLEARKKVGIVFQDPDNQLFSASVYQEISFGILNLGAGEADAEKAVEQVIEELEISPFRHQPTHALSGGQKKQVSIADILVMDPEIIIFDEPAAALDPKHSRMVRGIVDRLSERGITILISTHDVDFAMDWADEVLLFHEGKVKMHGSPEQVFSNPSVLAQTNLEQPACLQLFDSLCKKGILSASLPVPRNLKILETYIEQIQNRAYRGNAGEKRERKQAILAVSFGTTCEEARKTAIEAVEQEFSEAFPGWPVYRAWTSGIIRRKLREREGLLIDSVPEAMERMRADGITDVLIQPTHMVNGIENERMKADALARQEEFLSLTFGEPLLSGTADCEAVIRAVQEEFSSLPRDEALVLMGHGTTHHANSVYAALDYQFKNSGSPNVYLGTVEAYPSMETILSMLREARPARITLAPFMIVAGEHARNDMAGEGEESWKKRLEKEGFEVACVMKGLGEYPAVRKLLVRHLKEAWNLLHLS